MFVNTFQFLYQYLSQRTLVRLCHAYDDPSLKLFLKQKVGYTTPFIQPLLKGKIETFISLKDSMKIHITDNQLILNNNGNRVVFKCILKDDDLELVAIQAKISNRSQFKAMISTFKQIVDDFHIDKCRISHAKDIMISLKMENNQYLIIPPYINLTIFDDTTVHPIYLDDLMT